MAVWQSAQILGIGVSVVSCTEARMEILAFIEGWYNPRRHHSGLDYLSPIAYDVIHRFDGYIAQHLGDALLVYFGYPHAHEDDAQRAIHTGLGMLEAMKTLNIRLEQENFLRAVMDREFMPEVSAEEGLEALECAEKILASVKKNTWNEKIDSNT